MEDKDFKKRRKISKLFFVLVGHLSLGLGLVGMVVPLLPTTPFLLLAAACYMRGSEPLYNWLMNHHLLGPYIANYREGKGIPMKLKVTLLVLIWITIPLSAIILIEQLYVRLALLAIAMVVSAMIWRLPTMSQAFRDVHATESGSDQDP